jgi:adenylyltransferase/sulfurtransferase
MAKVKIPTPLRKYTDDQSVISVEANNVKDALNELTKSHPEIKPHLIDGEGQLKGFVRLYLGEDDIESLNGLSTEIETDTQINIIPAIAGGK